MKLSNLLQAKNPLTDKKTSIFDLEEIVQSIMGVVFMIVIFAVGQNVANYVGRKVPQIDTQIDPIITRPGAMGEIII